MFFTLTKNCAVALLGSAVRAMATVPRSLRSLLAASFLMGARVAFSFMAASMPPPWTMNRGMTRWKIVPS